RPPALRSRMCKETLAGLARQLDTEQQQFACAGGIDATRRKAVEARLVARGQRDIGARNEVIVVHLLDQPGLLDQHPRRPQRIADVRAAALELGRHGAVDHVARSGLQHDGYRILVVRIDSTLGGALKVSALAISQKMRNTGCAGIEPSRSSFGFTQSY